MADEYKDGALGISASINTDKANEGAEQFIRSIDNMEKRVNRFSDSVGQTEKKFADDMLNMSRSVDGLDQVLGTLGATLGATFTAFSVQEFLSKVHSIRGEFQQLEIAFTTMLGSAEQANALMNQLINTAAKTPFNMSDVTNGAKMLLAYGTAADEVNGTLLKIGDIAAGLSVPLNDLIYLYGTTMVQGRMFTQDMQQFTGRGIPLADELAKQFGVAKSEIGDMVTAGKVGADEFQKALFHMADTKFANLMEKQSASLTGQMSNLEDNIEQIYNKVGKKMEGGFAVGMSIPAMLTEDTDATAEAITALVKTITAVATGWGVAKAALMLYNAATKAAYATEIAQGKQRIAQLEEEIGLEKQKTIDADLEADVQKGRITAEKAKEVQAIRDAIKAKEDDIAVNQKLELSQQIESDKSKIEEVTSAIEEQVARRNELNDTIAEYDKKLADVNERILKATDEGDREAIDEALLEEEILLRERNEIAANAEGAQIEINTLRKERNGLQAGVNANTQKLETISRNTNTVSTETNTVATEANTTATKGNIIQRGLSAIRTNVATVAEKAHAFAINTSKKALDALKLAYATNPFGFWITALSTVIGLFWSLSDAEEENASITDRFGDAVNDSTDNIKTLVGVINGTNASSKVHKEAVEQLSKIYESYGEKLVLEKDKVNESTEAHLRLIKALQDEAIAREQANMIAGFQEGKKNAIDDLIEKLEISGTEYAETYKRLIAGVVEQHQQTMEEISKLSIDELKKRAKEDGIINYDKLTEEGLRKAVSEMELRNKVIKETDKLAASLNDTNVKGLHIMKENKDVISSTSQSLNSYNVAQNQVVNRTKDISDKTRIYSKDIQGLKEELNNIAKTYNIKVNLDIDDSAIPDWMKKLGWDSSQYQQSARYWTAQASDMAKKGIKRRYYKSTGQWVTPEEAAKKAAQYRKQAENEQKREDKGEGSKATAEAKKEIADIKKRAEREGYDSAINKLQEKANNSSGELQKEYEDAISALKKKRDAANNRSARSAQSAADLKERQAEKRKALKEEVVSQERENTDAGIALIKDESERRRREIESSYDKEIETLKKKARQWAKENKDAKMEGTTSSYGGISGLTAEQAKSLEGAESVALRKLKDEEETLNKERMQNMYDYLKEYGTIDQQRFAITKEYEEKIANAKDEYLKASLEKERDSKLRKLSADSAMESLNSNPFYMMAMQDTSLVSGSGLVSLKDALEGARQSLITLPPDQLQVIANLIKSIDEELIGRDPFSSWKEGIEELTKANHELAEAENAVKIAKLELIGAELLGDPDRIVEAQQNLNNALNRQANATNAVASADNKVKRSKKSVADVIGRLGSEISGVGSQLEQFGGDAGKYVQLIGGVVSAVSAAMQTSASTATGAMKAIETASVILAVISSAIQLATMAADLLGFTKDDSQYENAKAEYDALVDTWDTLISRKQEYLDISWGSEVKNVEREIQNLIGNKTSTAQQLARERADAGASKGSHSYGYRMNRDLGSQFVQIGISSVYDLTYMNAEQLKKIQENYTSFWAHLDGDFREALEDIIAYGDEAEELADKVNEKFTQISFDSLYDNFVDKLMDMEADASDFSENLSEIMTRSLLANEVGSVLQGRLKEWYKAYAEALKNANGKLSQAQLDDYKRQYNQLVDEGLEMRDRIADITGYDQSSNEAKSTINSAKSMTEDTANELVGRVTAVQLVTERMSIQEMAAFTDMRQSLKTIAEHSQLTQEDLAKIRSISEEQLGYISEIRDIQLEGIDYLNSISKSNNELYAIREDINRIASKIQTL